MSAMTFSVVVVLAATSTSPPPREGNAPAKLTFVTQYRALAGSIYGIDAVDFSRGEVGTDPAPTPRACRAATSRRWIRTASHRRIRWLASCVASNAAPSIARGRAFATVGVCISRNCHMRSRQWNYARYGLCLPQDRGLVEANRA